MRLNIDIIAKGIAASIYTTPYCFMYYLNGYRIIGKIIPQGSIDISTQNAKSMVIDIEKILDRDMKSLQIKFGNDAKFGTFNGIKTIYIKSVPPYEHKRDIVGTVSEYESMFDLMADQSHPNTIDYTEYNDVSRFQYLDCIVHVRMDVTDASGDIRVVCVEIDRKSYTVCEATNIGYARTQLTSSILYVKLVPKPELKKYENLFIWIEDRHIIKKLQTIQNAERIVNKIKTGLERCDEIRVQLKDQIAKLENQLTDLEKNITSEQNTMAIYLDLIKLAN